MEPTLDEALGALFGSLEVQQTETQVAMGNTELDQARVKLAEAQKEIDPLKGLLNEPAGSTPTDTLTRRCRRLKETSS